MSLFDRLYIECPKCNSITECQSKSGECNLNEYDLEDAPLLVIADVHEEGLHDRLYCDDCGAKLKLNVRFVASVSVVDSDDGINWRDV